MNGIGHKSETGPQQAPQPNRFGTEAAAHPARGPPLVAKEQCLGKQIMGTAKFLLETRNLFQIKRPGKVVWARREVLGGESARTAEDNQPQPDPPVGVGRLQHFRHYAHVY